MKVGGWDYFPGPAVGPARNRACGLTGNRATGADEGETAARGAFPFPLPTSPDSRTGSKPDKLAAHIWGVLYMLLGLTLANFTILHVVISLIGIVAGIIFFGALMCGRWIGFFHGLFIDFTVLTSVTGFMFPPKPIGPPFIFGVVSLVLLFIALVAQHAFKLNGTWRRVHLGTALIAQWLNMVVLVVQSFQKVPTLHALAPTGAEPAVLAGQALVLLIVAFFAWKTIVRPAPLPVTAV